MKAIYNIISFLLIFSILGCITYRNFPYEKVGKPPKKTYNTLYYKIAGGTIFGGRKGLRKVFKKNSPFNKSERIKKIPGNGLFVNVVVEQIMPSGAALIFGYLSLSTLTIIPVWSTEDGYDVYYELYLNGKKIKVFDYEIRRKGFVWIVMIVAAWVNIFTYSEEEAFEATAYQFFDDANSFFTR